jgi:hypothetical protein
MIAKTFTPENGGEGFVIMKIATRLGGRRGRSLQANAGRKFLEALLS